MQDMTLKKEQFIDEMIALARMILIAANKSDTMDSAYSVNEFNEGGANQFVDADFLTKTKHMTADIVEAVMFAIGTIAVAIDQGKRDALLECIPGGLP